MAVDIWGYGYMGNFWLRSPNNDNNANVGIPGGGNDNNDNVNTPNNAVRPDLPELPETRRQAPAVRAQGKGAISPSSAERPRTNTCRW